LYLNNYNIVIAKIIRKFRSLFILAVKVILIIGFYALVLTLWNSLNIEINSADIELVFFIFMVVAYIGIISWAKISRNIFANKRKEYSEEIENRSRKEDQLLAHLDRRIDRNKNQ